MDEATTAIAATVLAQQIKLFIAEMAYLRSEIAYLRDQLPKDQNLHFTDQWRNRLARTAARVGWKWLTDIATVVKGATIRGWYRLMVSDGRSLNFTFPSTVSC